MKLIREYHGLVEAQDMAMRLREHGIVTHTSSTHSFILSGLATGAFKVGLWAVLDSQYEDACAYALDPLHEITSGLSEQEVIAWESQIPVQTNAVFSRFMLYAFIGIAFFAGLALWLIANDAA